MVARIEKQDSILKNEFLKRIEAKARAEKDAMQERLKGQVPSILAKVLSPVAGVVFDYSRGMDKLKGSLGETNVGVKLRLGLSSKWVLMNDVILEPEPDVFAQIDHILLGPPGLFIIETKAWQGAYTGYKDKWKRKEGNKWIPCDSPTKQNLRHAQLIKKWLANAGQLNTVTLQDNWIIPLVVFTNASWLKSTDCCMPVFNGAFSLLDFLLQQKAVILDENAIKEIVLLLTKPNKRNDTP